jgi:hypothetical protein
MGTVTMPRPQPITLRTLKIFESSTRGQREYWFGLASNIYSFSKAAPGRGHFRCHRTTITFTTCTSYTTSSVSITCIL